MSAPISLPPAFILPSLATAAPEALSLTVLGGAPQALAALAAGAALSGTISASAENGALILLTAQGALAIKSSLPLVSGTRLDLQALAGQPGTAIILEIDDAPVAARGSLQTAAPPARPPSVPPTVIAFGGTLVNATVVAPETLAAAALPTPPGASPSPPPAGPSVAIALESAAPPSGSARADAVPPADPQSALPPTPAAIPAAPASTRSLATPAQNAPPARGAAPGPVGAAPGLASAATPAIAGTGRGAAPVSQLASVPAAPAAIAWPSPPVGSSLPIRILAVQAPPATSAAPAAAAPALIGTLRNAAAVPAVGAAAIVDTPAGPLELQGAPALPAGAQVALRLVAGSAGAEARLTILPSPASPSPTAAPAETGERSAPPPASAVVPPEPAGATASAPAPEPLEPSPPEATAVATPATGPAPRAPSPPNVPAATAEPRILLASPPESGRRAAPLVVGTVLAGAAAGPRAATLVATPLGVLALPPRFALPSGSLVLLAPQDPGPLDAIAAPVKAAEHGWRGLDGALAVLQRSAPELAAQIRADLSTQAGERLAASLLFLANVLRGGGPAWPGEAVAHALAAAGRDDVKAHLAEDVEAATRLAANPATSPWQVYVLPLVEGAAVRPVRLYVKRRDGRGRKGAADESSRFVLEFEMSRLGALQLDGLVQRRRFDLMLRSRAPLGAAIEQAVERIFNDRIAAAGYGGTIGFATVDRFEVAPLDQLRGHLGLAV